MQAQVSDHSGKRGAKLLNRGTGQLEPSFDTMGRIACALHSWIRCLEEEENETMNKKIIIRNETHEDISAITEVTIAAFKTLEISNHTEQFIIEALRAAKALTVSLVAEMDGRVIGHIAFSPIMISDGTANWYGLGPVSVLPEHQRQGIGKALIREGLARLKDMNAQGCCLVGHPDYYRKFGFRNVSGLVHEGVPQEVFFALSFDGHIPQGTVTFHEGFKADRQQKGAGDTLQST
jgi:putative acetyltransferase